METSEGGGETKSKAEVFAEHVQSCLNCALVALLTENGWYDPGELEDNICKHESDGHHKEATNDNKNDSQNVTTNEKADVEPKRSSPFDILKGIANTFFKVCLFCFISTF